MGISRDPIRLVPAGSLSGRPGDRLRFGTQEKLRSSDEHRRGYHTNRERRFSLIHDQNLRFLCLQLTTNHKKNILQLQQQKLQKQTKTTRQKQ